MDQNLSLDDNGIVHDLNSGRKVVLKGSGLFFFETYQKLGHSDAAIDRICNKYSINKATATQDYKTFLDQLIQGQRCKGSILPGQHHAVLEPTSGCNGGCPHCYHSSHGETWSDELEQRVMEGLKNSNIKSVSITGGEVFSAHYKNRFYKLVFLLKNENIKIASISTNATFITEEVRDFILGNIKQDTVFRISLDALRGELLDRVRPGYSKLADPYSPISHLDDAGYDLVFSTNIWKQSIEGVLAIGEYIRRFENIKAWNVRMPVPVHYEGGSTILKKKLKLYDERPDVQTPLSVYREILKRHSTSRYQFDVRLGNYLTTSLLENPNALSPKTDIHPCREDKKLVTFKATGTVTQCPILTELLPGLAVGNLSEDNFQLDEKLTDSLPLSDLRIENMGCADCRLLPVCGGGCRLYSVAYGQGLDGCDLPARTFLEWIENDESGLLQEHWPSFHKKFTSMINGE